MPSITRRNALTLLGSCTVVGLAGSAVAYAEPDGAPFVLVNNQTRDEQIVSTVIRRAEPDETIVDETASIDSNDEAGYDNLVGGETLVVTIQTADELEQTYRWEATDSGNALSVGITSDRIGFAVATPS